MTDHQQETELVPDFLYTLLDDVYSAFQALQESPPDYHRRNFVRAVFAAIEGVCSDLKRRCLAKLEAKPTLYSQAEQAILREETYYLNHRGQAISRSLFPRLDENVRFVFAMFTRPLPIQPQIDFTGVGWQAFRTAIEIRHRLTHPKRALELDVADSELEAVMSAYRWFVSTLTLNALDGVAAYEAQASELEMELCALRSAARTAGSSSSVGTQTEDEPHRRCRK